MAQSPVDVAEALLVERNGETTTKQLQKLTFYADAVHLVRTGKPLVEGGFEAWKGGPVSRDLYREHVGRRTIDTVKGDPAHLDAEAVETVRLTLELYGHLSGDQLAAMSHLDGPWAVARGELPPNAPSKKLIDEDLIRDRLGPVIGSLIEAHAAPSISLEDFKAHFNL